MTIARINRDPFAGRHRAARRRPFGRLVKIAAAAGALAAGATIASGLAVAHTPPGTPWLPQQAASVVQAAAQLPIPARQAQMTTAATTTAKIKPNWQARTCDAFAGYQKHHDATDFRNMVVNSTYLPKSYLRADVAQLYADVSSPSSTAAKYVSDDEQFLYEDCNNGSGL